MNRNLRETLADWPQGKHFPRFLVDLMRAELARLRPGANLPSSWPDADADADLGVDSLEQLNLAIAVSTALCFAQGRRPDALQSKRSFNEWLGEARAVLMAAPGAFLGKPGDLCFKTSGSTGEPRFITHDFAALAQEVDELASLFGGAERVVTSIPSHHIYGFLFTILLPRRLGAEVLDARGNSPASLAALLRPGDLVIAFPTIWEAAAQAGVAWPMGVTGVTSGAPCPSDAAREIRAKGLGRFVEIHGSTETGGIGWRDDPAAGFQLFPFWSKQDEDRIGKDFGMGMRLFELPDVVAWDGADRLAPQRRRDGAVQVAGVNVYPDFVRAVISAHPEVAGAAVRLMRPGEGMGLKAFVTLRRAECDLPAFRLVLENWLRQRLNAAQMPRAISFGPELPRTEGGKPADWAI